MTKSTRYSTTFVQNDILLLYLHLYCCTINTRYYLSTKINDYYYYMEFWAILKRGGEGGGAENS